MTILSRLLQPLNILILLSFLFISGTAAAEGGYFSKLLQQNHSDTIAVDQLPAEAQQTLKLIKQGGPFPYSRDGVIFGNREKRLPKQARGYYKEYTVKTPGARNRGARRIIASTKGEYFYTDDHYETFRLIKE
jgi:ribonuclease T1